MSKRDSQPRAEGDRLDPRGRVITSSPAGMSVTSEEQRRFVLGRRVAEDVPAPSGGLLLRKGETVTADVADEAERLEVLDRVYLAAGGSIVTAPPPADSPNPPGGG